MANLAKSYFFWTYPRGSFHYDILVTAILIFMFGSPFLIDFKDRPVETVALHASEILVKEDGQAGFRSRFIYQIRADDIKNAPSKAQRLDAERRLIEPISGEVFVMDDEEVKDAAGRTIAYNATVLR